MRVSLVMISVLAVAAVLSLASAQIDDRARALLDGLLPGVAQEIETIDQSIVMTTYLPDGASMEMRSRTVIDFVNRRLITFIEPNEGIPSMTMIYQDGQATMIMSDTDTALPVPPGMGESLEASFDQQPSISLNDSNTVTYDGQVDYEVLKGEQVTQTTSLPGSTEPITVSYVFQGGKLVGTHTVADDLEVVSVFDAPVSSLVVGAIDSTGYISENGTWTKISHIHYEATKINEPIDESLFE